jgi:hypothetical protein
MTMPDRAVGVEPWDTEWAAQKASEALHYLARNCPECAASEALREHEEAAPEAAMRGDEEATWRPYAPTCELVGTRPCGFVGARGMMVGIITARTLDYFGLLVAASVFALVSAGVTAICIKYEERVLAWLWTAAYFSCGLAAAYFLWRLL